MARQTWREIRTSSDSKPTMKAAASTLFHVCTAVILGVGTAVGVLALFCPRPRIHAYSWIAVVVLAGALLSVASYMSGGVARVVCWMARDNLAASPASVERAAWIGGLWVPAWVLYLREPSFMTVLAGCFCIMSVGRSLKPYGRENVEILPGVALKGISGAPLYFDDSKALVRVILPSVAVAVLAEVAAVAMFAKRYQIASVLAGSCVAVLMWRFGSKASARREETSLRTMTSLGLAFLLTVVALLPYLRSVRLAAWGEALLGSGMSGGRLAEPRREPPTTSSDGYSGIILLPVTDTKKKIVAPRRRDGTVVGIRRAERMVIPFDGAYWYFKAPDRRPRPTARIVHASSMKAIIRSTDSYPLLMEAHQRLDPPIDLSCCSKVEVAVVNADRNPGTIALELWFTNRGLPGRGNRYLGTVVIPSSESGRSPLSNAQVEETLEFPLSEGLRGVQFDEITIVIRIPPVRARAGAQIAIRRFVLH